MWAVLKITWPLLTGVMLLMVGNGVQASLLGIRGAIEGFSTGQMSMVMAAYFAGFLAGSRLTPAMIRGVGHVRVFAAMGSVISALLVLYPMVPDWLGWAGMRVVTGFAFAAIYITAESWLNNVATNETRGRALSAYMIVQMVGVIASQALLGTADPRGFELFVIPSVLVSLAFLPLLLAPSPAPVFGAIRAMPFARLWTISPLGCVGMLLTGGIFATMFSMAAVWGTLAGLTVGQIALFVGVMYAGGLVLQLPLGWLSDRMDRRVLVVALSAAGAVAMAVAAVGLPFAGVLAASFLLGGITNPLYALLIAYTNDFLARDEMPAASAGLIFLNGFGAIFGPLASGWIIGRAGPGGFFLFMGVLFAALAAYAGWRMTRRATPAKSQAVATVSPVASALAVEAVMERGAGDPRAG